MFCPVCTGCKKIESKSLNFNVIQEHLWLLITLLNVYCCWLFNTNITLLLHYRIVVKIFKLLKNVRIVMEKYIRLSGPFWMIWRMLSWSPLPFIGRSRGGRAWHPPQGSKFFRFDIQNFQNITASGVHAPPVRGPRPPMGNPGSATAIYIV